jgi:hypothetical protein
VSNQYIYWLLTRVEHPDASGGNYKIRKHGGVLGGGRVVIVTYQDPTKRRWQYITISVVLKQKEICPLYYPSHPICQCRAAHGWQRGTHQERYRPSRTSDSPGAHHTMFPDAEYAIGSVIWRSS